MKLTPRQRTLLTTLLLVALLYLCFFYGLSSFGFVGPDEPRYAAIAREMGASGDWVTPRLQGHPWFEKPVLYYWSAGLAYKTFSNDEVAARMPSGVFAILTVLAMAWAARRFYGDQCALAVLLMLPTCAGMIGFARAAATDMPFAACLTLAMVAASQLVWGDGGARGKWAAAFGASLGLAVLAKGPAALVLTGGSIALWVVATRRWRDSLGFLHPLGILLFCATALPWYALCAARNPEFLRVFLLEHNFERFLTNRYQHAQPFWFFVLVLLIGLFPWTILLGACARDAAAVFRERRGKDSPGFFLCCWALFPFLFFSASQSKLPGYILPAIPPLVLLMARSLTRAPGFLALPARPYLRTSERQQQLQRINPGFVMLGKLLSFLADMQWLETVALLDMSRHRRPLRAVAAVAAVTAVLVALIVIRVLPRLDEQISPRAAAITAMEQTAGGKDLYLYRLPRPWAYGMNYYLKRELPEWNPPAEGAAPAPQNLWIVTSDVGRKDLETRQIRPVFEQRTSGGATLLHIAAK